MKSNRRTFLKNSSALALGSLVLPRMAEASLLAKVPPIGIQLFTVNRLIEDNIQEILQKIAAVGYKEIESAFSMKGYYYGLTPKEFSKMVSDLGMTWRSHHVMGAPFRPRPTPPPSTNGQPAPTPRFTMPKLATLQDGHQQLIDEAAEGGLKYLVCASTPVGTLDEIKASIEVFNKTGEACKKAGISFVYHNHATEFDLVEGKRPYDLILGQTDKELVKMELDMAWAVKAKQDPVELFKGNPGRFPLWHIKDIDKDLVKITEVGNGVVDFKKIFEAAKEAGMKHFFVEQDMVQSFESVSTCYTNLVKILS